MNKAGFLLPFHCETSGSCFFTSATRLEWPFHVVGWLNGWTKKASC